MNRYNNKYFYWPTGLLALFVILLVMTIPVYAYAMRLKGDGVEEVKSYIRYVYGENVSETYDDIFRVTTIGLYPCAAPEYGLKVDGKNYDLFYYKKGIEGTPVVLGVEGIVLLLENLSDNVIVIKWSESSLQLGAYDGVPFFGGMKYADAGKPNLLADTILPPHYEKRITLYLGNPRFVKGGAFNSAYWQDGYAVVREDKSLRGLLCMKIESNNVSKYYTFRTPRIELPDSVIDIYKYEKE